MSLPGAAFKRNHAPDPKRLLLTRKPSIAAIQTEINMLVTILIIVLILVLLGGGYGYRGGNRMAGGAGGLLGLILIILIILALMGRI
jgi:hypothetical protein